MSRAVALDPLRSISSRVRAAGSSQRLRVFELAGSSLDWQLPNAVAGRSAELGPCSELFASDSRAAKRLRRMLRRGGDGAFARCRHAS